MDPSEPDTQGEIAGELGLSQYFAQGVIGYPQGIWKNHETQR